IALEPFSQDQEKNAKLVEQYPDALMDAVKLQPDLKCDAIIVDEGQDFDAIWWAALESCLRDQRSIFYIFYDDNQMLYQRNAELPEDVLHFRLGKNIRNARPIFDLVAKHYRSREAGAIQSVGPDGREVEKLSYSSDEELAKCVSETLQRW